MKKKFPPPSHRPVRASKKQKKEPLPGTRQSRKLQKRREKEKSTKQQMIFAQAERQGLVPVDRTKLVSSSVMPRSEVPWLGGLYYLDYEFTCKDCGSKQIWTGRQQKWWHEVMGGEIEQIAIRCRACRIKERARKTEARKVHFEGLEKKRIARTGVDHLKRKQRKRPGNW